MDESFALIHSGVRRLPGTTSCLTYEPCCENCGPADGLAAACDACNVKSAAASPSCREDSPAFQQVWQQRQTSMIAQEHAADGAYCACSLYAGSACHLPQHGCLFAALETQNSLSLQNWPHASVNLQGFASCIGCTSPKTVFCAVVSEWYAGRSGSRPSAGAGWNAHRHPNPDADHHPWDAW